AVAGPLDRVRGAYLGTRRRVAVHTDHRHRLHRLRAVHVFQVDHRVPLVRVALGTRVDARLAADAAVRVEEEDVVVGDHGLSFPGAYCCGSRRPAYSGGESALRMRTAHTLYSGILDTGSWAAMVVRFTLLAPAQ